MATCKEYDEMDEPCVDSDISPMSLRMSDECALDNGNDSDGSDTDSSNDSTLESTQGVHVIIQYKCKVAKKLVDFKLSKYIPLTLGHYLKWQYIVGNPTQCQQKIQGLKKIAEAASITDGILEMSLGRQRRDPDFDAVKEDIKDILLSNTDSICISWFPLNAFSNSKDVYQMLTGIVQQSEIGGKQELYTDMADSRIIRFVFDIKNKEKVDEIATKTVQDYAKKQISECVSTKRDLPVVYYHIFNALKVKEEARKEFPAVRVFFDVIESKHVFRIKLRGQRNDVHSLNKWIENSFINPCSCIELDFGGIEGYDETLHMPSVIEETLKMYPCLGLYWSIDEYSKKVWICSENIKETHSAIEAVKRCIKQSKRCIKPMQVEETEQMITDLVAAEDNAIGISVSLTILSGCEELTIFSKGFRNQLQNLVTWFDTYNQTTTEDATDTSVIDSMVRNATGGLEAPSRDNMAEKVYAGESEDKMTVAREDKTWFPIIHHTTIDAFPMPRKHMEEGKGPGTKKDTRSMPGKHDVSEEDKRLVPDAYKHLEPDADKPVMPGDDGSSEKDSQIQRGPTRSSESSSRMIRKKPGEKTSGQESFEKQVRKSAATSHQPLVQVTNKRIETSVQQCMERRQNGLELNVIVKYQQVKEFNIDESMSCTHDTFMRCHYVMGNPQMFNTISKHWKAKNKSEISIEDNDGDIWLIIDMGKVTKKPTHFRERSRDLAIKQILQQTDDLIINSIQTTIIDKFEAARLLMKYSKEELGNELWLYVDDMSDFIHYVYPNERGKKVEDTINTVVAMLMKGEKCMILELVFSKVFEYFNVKQTLKKKYEEKVMSSIDCMESTNTCKLTLKGKMSELESAEEWIKINHVDPYFVNSISVGDIKGLITTNLNIEHVVRDALSQDELGDVFWYVNSTFRRIEVCSKSTTNIDKTVACLKTCLKPINMPLEYYANLEKMSEVIEGRAFVEKQKDTVKVLGTNVALKTIKKHLVDLSKDKFGKDVERGHQRGVKEHCGQESVASIKSLDEQDKDNQMHVITQKIGFRVENVNDFKMLCSSQELKKFASQNDVVLTETPREQNNGFILSGSTSNCLKVKEKLTKMIQENTSKLQEKHWSLN